MSLPRGNPRKRNYKWVSVRLQHDVWEWLNTQAEKEGLSRSTVIRRILAATKDKGGLTP